MQYNVSWIFRLVNKYSPDAKRISNDSAKIDKSTEKAARSIVKKNTALRKYQASLLKTKRRLREYKRESMSAGKASGFLLSKLKAIAAIAITGLGITAMVETSSRIEDSIADLSAITGAAGADLRFYSDEMKRLSVTSKVMQDEVGRAFKTVASAKSELLDDPKALSVVTEQVLLLKNASGIDTDQSAKVLTESLNQFTAGADQASRFVNVLAAGSKVGASEVNETGVAVVKSGVAAKLAKVSFEELNAMIQVLAKNGVKAEVAGTGLQNVLLKLETSGIDQIRPSSVGAVKALENLQAAGLSAEQQQKLFGLEGIKVGAILSENSALVKEWTKQITGTTIAQEQANKRLGTFGSMLKLTKIKIVNLSNDIFRVARPAFVSLGETVDGFIESLSDPSDVEFFGMLLGGLTMAVKGLGEVFSLVFNAIVEVLKPPMAMLKGIATLIGQISAAVMSLDFSNFDLSDSFSLGGKFLGSDWFEGQYQALAGFFGGGKDNPSEVGAVSNTVTKVNESVTKLSSATNFNGEIMVRAAPGTEIDSISQKSTGDKTNFNIGQGLASAF